MKKALKIISIITFVFWLSFSFAQGTPPPGDGAEGGGDPVGGPAPIGSGVYIMLIAGFAYGFTKIKFLKEADLNKIEY